MKKVELNQAEWNFAIQCMHNTPTQNTGVCSQLITLIQKIEAQLIAQTTKEEEKDGGDVQGN